ncbi:YodL domain-containing protein, partial [Clostridioides difficile]
GWEFDGGKVEANTEANRLQIFFEDKPDEATREALKSNGFRWSPKAGAWQRQLTSNAYYAADYVKAIAPLTGEKPTELQRAHIRQQKVAAQKQPVQEQPEQKAPQSKDTFSIYQIKGGDETRDLRFEPYDRLTATGHRVDPKNYALVYSAELTPGTSLEDIYTRFNIDHPKDFKGHSLSVSDVVVLHQNGQDTAHYVDSFGYKDVPEFFKEQEKAL